jgi:hypothetical protein
MRFSARVSLTVALLVGASLLSGFQSDRVVARVGGDTVSLGELRHWMDRLSEQGDVSDPVKEAQAIADRAMALIIDHRLLKQEAKANGVPDVTEEDFQRRFLSPDDHAQFIGAFDPGDLGRGRAASGWSRSS